MKLFARYAAIVMLAAPALLSSAVVAQTDRPLEFGVGLFQPYK